MLERAQTAYVNHERKRETVQARSALVKVQKLQAKIASLTEKPSVAADSRHSFAQRRLPDSAIAVVDEFWVTKVGAAALSGLIGTVRDTM